MKVLNGSDFCEEVRYSWACECGQTQEEYDEKAKRNCEFFKAKE